MDDVSLNNTVCYESCHLRPFTVDKTRGLTFNLESLYVLGLAKPLCTQSSEDSPMRKRWKEILAKRNVSDKDHGIVSSNVVETAEDIIDKRSAPENHQDTSDKKQRKRA